MPTTAHPGVPSGVPAEPKSPGDPLRRNASSSSLATHPPSTSSALYRRAQDGVQRTKTIMKDSPLQLLGLSHKKTPKINEIVEQSKIICEDYIYRRLEAALAAAQGKDGGAGGAGGSDGPPDQGYGSTQAVPTISDVSREIQMIGAKLESTYPTLYQNVSRQVGMTFRSDINARKALNSISDVMFRHNVTWGRIVAMFAITASIATECAQNDRPEAIRSIVNIFADVIERNAAAWISQQGGWVEIMKAFRLNKETRSLWALTGLGAMIGFIFTWITTVQI